MKNKDPWEIRGKWGEPIFYHHITLSPILPTVYILLLLEMSHPHFCTMIPVSYYHCVLFHYSLSLPTLPHNYAHAHAQFSSSIVWHTLCPYYHYHILVHSGVILYYHLHCPGLHFHSDFIPSSILLTLFPLSPLSHIPCSHHPHYSTVTQYFPHLCIKYVAQFIHNLTHCAHLLQSPSHFLFSSFPSLLPQTPIFIHFPNMWLLHKPRYNREISYSKPHLKAPASRGTYHAQKIQYIVFPLGR